MSAVPLIEGQLSIFDLLIPEPVKPLKTVSTGFVIPTVHRPLTDQGLYCIWCGREYAGGYGGFDYSANHGNAGTHRGVAQCVSMELTRSHCFHFIHELNARLTESAFVYPCCVTKQSLHKKHVRTPTAEQLAEHIRFNAQRAIESWGVHRADFLQMYRTELAKYGLENYAYQLPFTVTTGPNKYDEKFCAYCGTTKRLDEGGCGPASNESPDYSYNICVPCSEKYRCARPPMELWTYKELL